MRILFFIGTLNTGGAERQIAQLALALSEKNHEVFVRTLYSGGQYWEFLQRNKVVNLDSLFINKKKSKIAVLFQFLRSVFLLRKFIKKEKLSLIYSILYATNFLTWLATLGVVKKRLVWGLRTSNAKLGWKRLIPFYLCKLVSKRISLAIANSHSGLIYHKSKGFDFHNIVVIPNGIDVNYYRPEQKLSAGLSGQWRSQKSNKIIGLVARLDPEKDHHNFIHAAALLSKKINDVKFVCVGAGPEKYRQELLELCNRLGIAEKFVWMGNQTDMPPIYNALDILVLSSRTEGFPNVVGEAMACNTPCVVTDVGDSALVVGDTGVVVPPQNPEALMKGMCDLLSRINGSSNSMIRERIITNFSLESLVERTENELSKLNR